MVNTNAEMVSGWKYVAAQERKFMNDAIDHAYQSAEGTYLRKMWLENLAFYSVHYHNALEKVEFWQSKCAREGDAHR